MNNNDKHRKHIATRNRSYNVFPAKGAIVRTIEPTQNGGLVPAGTEIVVRSVDNAGFRGIELHGHVARGPRAGDFLVGVSTGIVEIV